MEADLITIKVVVLCINSRGEPEFHCCTTGVTAKERDEGVHYDVAKDNANDSNDYAANQVGELLAWL